MRALMYTVLALAIAACSVMDNELDEIDFKQDSGGDSDGDSDADSDGDSDSDGDDCTVMVLDVLEMDGLCQATDAECEGGVYPMNPGGSCSGGDVCCIGTDQCEKYPVMLQCEDAECADEGGGPFGCPGNGWCCPQL